VHRVLLLRRRPHAFTSLRNHVYSQNCRKTPKPIQFNQSIIRLFNSPKVIQLTLQRSSKAAGTTKQKVRLQLPVKIKIKPNISGDGERQEVHRALKILKKTRKINRPNYLDFDLGPRGAVPAGTLSNERSPLLAVTDLASSQLTSVARRSSRSVSCHVFLGLPLLFPPSRVHCTAALAGLADGRRRTGPTNRFRLLSTVSCRLSTFVRSNNSSLLT